LCTERERSPVPALHCTALAAVSRPIVTRRHVRSTTMHGARACQLAPPTELGLVAAVAGRDHVSPGSTATRSPISMPKSNPCPAAQSRGRGQKKSGQLPPGRSRRKLGEEQKSCLGVVRPAGVETLTGRPPERVAGNRVHAAQREHRSTDGERWDEAGLERT